MKVRVYLVGDIAKTDRWRPKIIKAVDCGVEWLSPVDTVSYSYKSLTEANRDNKTFLYCDYMKVERADVIFCYLRKSKSRHSGSSAEIGYATKCKDGCNKVIILVNELPKEEAYLYEFIHRSADVWFDNLEDGISFLKQLVWEMNYSPVDY